MTETYPNPRVPRTPESQAPASRPPTTDSATSKLRDSCHACALAKVKCHKQKPTCSRCARRGLTCEYFHSKRPGRKRETQHSISTESNSEKINVDRPESLGGQDQWANATTYGSLPGATDYLIPLLTPLDSPKPGNVYAAERSVTTSSSSPSLLLHDFLNTPDSGLSSNITGLSTNFEDFFASPIDFLELEPLKTTPGFSHSRTDIAKLLIPNNTNPLPQPEALPTSHSDIFETSDSQALSTRIDQCICGPPGSASSCLMRALDVMKKLSSNKSPPNGLSPDRMGGTNTLSPSAQSVVLDNKQTIEAVSSMMACPCADDGYLLTILSMIVFKILARFATAAQKESDDKVSNTPDDEGGGRLATQSVLGELHRVQWLVNRLAPRLQSYKTSARSEWGLLGREADREESQNAALEGGGMKTAPFLATILEQVERHLRKAVSTLSAEIIRMLRQS